MGIMIKDIRVIKTEYSRCGAVVLSIYDKVNKSRFMWDYETWRNRFFLVRCWTFGPEFPMFYISRLEKQHLGDYEVGIKLFWSAGEGVERERYSNILYGHLAANETMTELSSLSDKQNNLFRYPKYYSIIP